MGNSVFLTGSSGLFGTRFIELMSDDWDIISCSRGVLDKTLASLVFQVSVDLKDHVGMVNALEKIHPDYIIHAGALTNVDQCEADPDYAYLINATATKSIAEFASRYDIPMVYISTDFVFPGTGEYNESDSPEPINVYGESKYKGEQFVSKLKSPWAILRPAFPYRSRFDKKLDLVRWMIKQFQEGKEIPLISDQHITPTFIDDLVFLTSAILSEGIQGIIHAASPDPITPFEMGHAISKKFNFDTNQIKPITFETYQSLMDKPAKRPKTSILKSQRLFDELDFKMLDFFEGLERLYAQLSV